MARIPTPAAVVSVLEAAAVDTAFGCPGPVMGAAPNAVTGFEPAP
jgi:hypothetical protein